MKPWKWLMPKEKIIQTKEREYPTDEEMDYLLALEEAEFFRHEL